ncbi:hypothetical protein TRIUR3_28511 [Triticum urartu]|uniref:Uncharacterized protein n=1 Tax=Triticum urartu TaxID=4572 RepID=M8A2S7_TRIUA|nr:hypothetical protein TRIUR3_28511 [Triticum urartu]
MARSLCRVCLSWGGAWLEGGQASNWCRAQHVDLEEELEQPAPTPPVKASLKVPGGRLWNRRRGDRAEGWTLQVVGVTKKRQAAARQHLYNWDGYKDLEFGGSEELYSNLIMLSEF